MILLPMSIVTAASSSPFIEKARTVMLIMIAFQQHHLIFILLLEFNDLHKVLKHLIRPILNTFFLIWVHIITEEDDAVYLIEILLDRTSPECATMHIGYYQYTLCHSILSVFSIFCLSHSNKKRWNPSQGTFQNRNGSIHHKIHLHHSWDGHQSGNHPYRGLSGA